MGKQIGANNGLANGTVKMFRNADVWLMGKTNDEQIKGELIQGAIARVTARGVSSDWFNFYANILDAEIIDGNTFP